MFILKEKMSVTVLVLKFTQELRKLMMSEGRSFFFRILTKFTPSTVPSVESLASLECNVDLSNW